MNKNTWLNHCICIILKGGVKTFDQLTGERRSLGVHHINLHTFCYSKLTHLLIDLFGKNNILLLPLEIIKADHNKYFNLLEQFLKSSIEDRSKPIQGNKGIEISNDKIQASFNRLRISHHQKGLIRANKPIINGFNRIIAYAGLSQSIELNFEKITEVWYRDNQLLQELIKFDLPSNYFNK